MEERVLNASRIVHDVVVYNTHHIKAIRKCADHRTSRHACVDDCEVREYRKQMRQFGSPSSALAALPDGIAQVRI